MQIGATIMSSKKTSSKPNKKSSKSKAKSRKPKKISTKDKSGDIKEASIAKFMRKRTQLVGFDYGHHKHTQYAVEFVDNALDAIEKFQWDAETNLEDLKNRTANAIAEFERFDYDARILMEKVATNESNLVPPLKKLYTRVPSIIDKITFVKREIQKVVGLSSGDSENTYETILKGSVTLTSFTQKYDAFIEEYAKLSEEYTQLIEQIDGMDKNPQFIFTLDKELTLQNLKFQANGRVHPVLKRKLNDSLNKNLRSFMEANNSRSKIPQADQPNVAIEQTLNLDAIQQELSMDEDLDDEEVKELQKLQKKEKDLEAELQTLIDNLENFLAPVGDIIDNEPLVILKLTESDPPDVYRERGVHSDSMLYTLEIFDNGTGMKPEDLMKFGKYLASSKSQKLRQTRGSQGFGSPSAFSDAQNTTGRPITAISKHSTHLYGVCSEFYTTEKNTKVYVVNPQEIETPFAHGSYVKLHYLNKKYNRGYVDSYIEHTALMNSHISFIYVDPKGEEGEEHFYPRKVAYFPKEPKYALPHPSSVKIGDFQDLLRASENLTVTAFLTDNFVRLSSKLAKTIVNTSEFEIECKLRFLNLGIGFLSAVSKTTDVMTFTRQESRIYGRSKNPRMKYVPYLIEGSLKDTLWAPIQEFNQIMKDRHILTKKQKSAERAINQPDAKKKDIKVHEKALRQIAKELDGIEKSFKKIKQKLKDILKSTKLENEIKHTQTSQKIEEIIGYLLISKTRPAELTQIQIEHLYMAFKNQSYMAPPTDTAIPVGESAIETAVIKQHNLTVSNRVDYFGNPEDLLSQIGDYERIKSIHKNLAKFNTPALVSENPPELVLNYDSGMKPELYTDTISELDLVHTIGDDFVAAHTRKPTSGKGLAFVVEAVMAYSPSKVSSTKKASQVVTRFVNRTPKMRDNADCALWQGIQNVKWKSYKVADTFDNGIPKGNYAIYINCSGPYTHLMFKSQSKNALAEDEVLIREVKFCLEAIGRKLRKYMNKKEIRERRSKRGREIEKNIPRFVESVYNIAKTQDKYKTLKKSTLEQKILETLSIETDPNATDQEIRKARKAQLPQIISPAASKPRPVYESKQYSSATSQAITASKITSRPEPKSVPKPVTKPDTPKPSTSAIPKPEVKPSVSSPSADMNARILKSLSDNEWHTLSDIMKALNITTIIDGRLVKVKLKALAIKGRILMGTKQGKNLWRIK